MQEPSVTHSSFVIERSFPKPPSTVFAAFAEEGKKRLWYATEETKEVLEFAVDFRVGGVERLKYKLKPGSPVAGMVVTNEGRYEDIVPDRLIVTATTMDLNERRILVSLLTTQFLASANGTDLILTHQGIYLSGPNGLTAAMIEAGWNDLLASFEKAAA